MASWIEVLSSGATGSHMTQTCPMRAGQSRKFVTEFKVDRSSKTGPLRSNHWQSTKYGFNPWDADIPCGSCCYHWAFIMVGVKHPLDRTRFSWEAGLWTFLWGLLLTALIEVGRPAHWGGGTFSRAKILDCRHGESELSTNMCAVSASWVWM